MNQKNKTRNPPKLDLPEEVSEADRKRLEKMGWEKFPTTKTDAHYWRRDNSNPIEERTLIAVLIDEKKW